MARGRGRLAATRRRVPGLSAALAVYYDHLATAWDSDRSRHLADAYASGDEVLTEGLVVWHALMRSAPGRPAAHDAWIADQRMWLIVDDTATLTDEQPTGEQR